MFSNLIASRSKRTPVNPALWVLALLPLLAFYIAVVIAFASPEFSGDEGGYVENATRLLNRPPVTPQDLHLWWGPGYPIVLVPFIALGAPLIAAKMMNAFFLFGAIAYSYALMRRYLSRKAALVTTLCLGLYYPFLREVPFLHSEQLTMFLICGFMYHFCALYNGSRKSRIHLFTASVFLAYLALTKVFFGYVISSAIALSVLSLVWRRARRIRIAIPVFLLALIWCAPYLLHTYSLTGKPFYWGTSGGLSLYWMSSPFPNEYGSWFPVKDVIERPELTPHRQFFRSLEGLTDVKRDEALVAKAIRNIARNPGKFAVHWAANVGRLFFSYPFSFGQQSLSTYFYLAPNMFVVTLFILSLIPAFLKPEAIPFELWALMAFGILVFGGSSLLSAYDRQFRPLVPLVFLWTTFVGVRILHIELRKESSMSVNSAASA